MLFFTASVQAIKPLRPYAVVCIGPICYDITLADTPTKRRLGLMYRDYMPQREGMLFAYDEPTFVRMWMKNTQLPLDIIWIDKHKHIIHIETQTKPLSETILAAPSKALFVLEINSGEVKKHGFEVGQRVELKRARYTAKKKPLPSELTDHKSLNGIPQLNGI